MISPSHTAPQAPRRIALVDASGTASTSALLADAAEALPVYAWLAGLAEPEVVTAHAGRDIPSCDTVLLALELGAACPRVEELPVGYTLTGTSVYALLCTDGDPEVAAYLIAELEERCDQRGLRWQGALAVGNARLLPHLSGRPRMGWARRRVSEAVDQLLIALLAGRPFGEKYVRPSRYARLTCRPH